MGDGSPPYLNPQHDIYEDRGDPNAWDFQLGNFTTDGNWHDLDLSSIVPSGAKAVILTGFIQDDAAAKFFSFRKNGNVNNYNRALIYTQVANLNKDFMVIIPLSSTRIIEYQASNTVWTSVGVCVSGWFN